MWLRSVAATLAVSLAAAACAWSPSQQSAPQYDSGGDGAGGDGAGTPAAGGDVGPQGGETTVNRAAAGGAESSEGGASAGPRAAFHGLYIGPAGLGSDTADGTVDAPFLTLAHAAGLAQAGDTIVFLDGTYALGAVVATPIPDGVDLMAQNSGEATLSGSGDLLELSGSTRIQGLTFQAFGHVVTYLDGADATGRLTIEDSSFSGCASACLDLPGAVEASVSAAADAVVANGGNGFAVLANAAKLTMHGGIVQQLGSAGVIRASDDSHVSLTDLQVLDGTGPVLVADDNTVAVVDGLTVATRGQGLFEQRGQSSLSVTNSDLSMRSAAPSVYYCFDVEMDGVGSLSIEDSHLHDCNTGIKGVAPANLTISGTHVHDMPYGLDLEGGGAAKGGVLRISDSMFFSLSGWAARTGANGPMDIKIRDSSFAGAASAVNYHTIYLQGASGSSFDLGTGADPGGNTFVSTNASYSGLWIGLGGVTTLASGNTWTPNAQSADAAGRYTAGATPGAKLDVTSTTPGQNYAKPYAGTLRLAENPP